jgi:hypothetical protein
VANSDDQTPTPNSAKENGSPPLHRVVADIGVALESAAEVRRDAPLPIGAAATAMASGRAELNLTPAPLTIVPTPYPREPGAPLVVHGAPDVDPRSPALRDLNAKLDQIAELLAGSNLFAIETRNQLIAEIQAGKSLASAPKPNTELIKALLINPLVFIACAAASAVIGELALQALHLIEGLFQVPIPM